MQRILPIAAWLERVNERLLGAALRGLTALLARVTRRGRHRAWRREQEQRAPAERRA